MRVTDTMIQAGMQVAEHRYLVDPEAHGHDREVAEEIVAEMLAAALGAGGFREQNEDNKYWRLALAWLPAPRAEMSE